MIYTDVWHFEFAKMPFGLKNASSSFQHFIFIVSSGISQFSICVYIDYVVIVSKSFQEHFKSLELVFQRLQEANLELKPSKCKFAQQEITYIEHSYPRQTDAGS